MRMQRLLLTAVFVLLAGYPGIASLDDPQNRSGGQTGVVHALLINGGSQPSSNYLSHLQHLQEMVELLRRRGIAPERIHVFSADGEEPAADLTTREAAPTDFWLVEDTALGNRLEPRAQLVDTPWHAVKLHPARLDELRRWFEEAGKRIPAGDRLLVFVTDHGGPGRNGPGSGTISLWHEQLTVRELRLLLDRVSPKVQVVTVMSQCYSGAFADLMYDGGVSAPPSGNTCGFFATTAEDKAYGCYPEGQDRDRIGYAFEFIDALNHQATAAQAHNQVTLSDSTPDRPRRTSDAYLSRLISDEARARGLDRDELADSLLRTAWRDAAAWEPEIRRLDAIGEAFGTFSPRSLREVKSREQDLVQRADQLKSYVDRWSAVSVDAKESLLRAFLAAHPDWRAGLEPRAIDQLSPDQRAALLARLLDELHPFARQSDIWPKFERFRAAASRGSDASWRFEVRKAAAERMRTILLTVAGRELLATTDPRRSSRDEAGSREAQRQALDALVQCEALNPGDLPARSSTTASAARASFPPLNDDIELLQQLQPSWLGVRYAPVPAALRTARPALAGAAQIQSVEDGSPAADAGLQPADVVLGPPEQPFKSSQELRDWTMTAPQGVALPLKTVRLGTGGSTNDGEFEAMVVLRPLPGGRRESGIPPRLGTAAPALADTLKSGRGGELPDLKGREHLLFFWATWCGPCKAALPEVMAFAEAKGMPALAVTDEEQATVSKFLDGWKRPFFESIAVDSYRQAFISYAISGTPTIVIVDADGVIRYRQVGYNVNDGLKVDGWRWSPR
jgi:thiol-disulfide isomerase/thioredoxin